MRWLYILAHRLQSLFRRKRLEQDLDDEFLFHLEQRIEAAVAAGMTPAQARADAIRALDNIPLRKEECRDTRGLNWIDHLVKDLRYAVRVLVKSPAFAIVAVVSLALGIGANTAIFSVMDVLLLRPLPVAHPERLQLLSFTGKFRPRYSFNYPMFELIRDRNHVFSETLAWSFQHFQTPVGQDMLILPGVFASGDYFSGLGVPPLLGRVFGREDDQPAGGKNGPVAVISEGYWARRYGRSPSVIGQSIVINGVDVTIIGVMPAGYFGAEVGTAPDIWFPLNMQRQLQGTQCIGGSRCWYLQVMGRLKPGISEAQARAELAALSRGIMLDNDPPVRADRRADFLAQIVRSEPGASGFAWLRSDLRAPLQVLMALVGLVLLIACANMANLLTARASARQREVAVRLAIGAGRGRIVRQFLTESLLLAVAGAAGGLVISFFATRALVALLSFGEDPIRLDLQPDWRVLLFTAVAAVFTGFLFGLAPAFRATRGAIGSALKERAHQVQSAEGRFGFTRLLLGGQVALSIVLLAAAGLLAESLVRLWTENPGFDPHDVTAVWIDTTRLPQKGPALIDLYGAIMRRARQLPKVESATLMSTTPLTNSGWDDYMIVPGRTDLTEERTDTDINAVGPDFFKTMRIPLLAGRDFDDGDTAQSHKVAIISENAARLFFPNGALGRDLLFSFDKTPVRIVGIAGNSKYQNLREDTPLTMFVPYNQWNQLRYVTLRTQAPVRQTYAAFRDLLRQVAPGTPIRTIKTMDQQLAESLSTERLTAYLSLFFAALALLLTAVGLYGILAYSVSRRTGEIGIRMALGAQRRAVMWLVVREAMAHTLAGAAVGLAAVVALSKLIKSLLYGVTPRDPAALLLAAAALALVCAAAAWLPARRASKLDPMVALREE